MTRSGMRGSMLSAPALLVLRGVTGVVIGYHGWQKIDGGVGNFADFVEFLDLPAPDVLAWVVTILEFVGGIMLVLGLLTRIPALLISIEMLFTTFLVKTSKLDVGLIAPGDQPGVGSEIDLMIFAGAFAVFLMGAGALSLDRWLGIEKGAVTTSATTAPADVRKVA